MEGWWGILKSEMYYLRKFTDKASLVAAIEEYPDSAKLKRPLCTKQRKSGKIEAKKAL
jgi:hypothetical protein